MHYITDWPALFIRGKTYADNFLISLWVRNAPKGATAILPELGADHKDIHAGPTVQTYPAPKDICTDFIADELDKIVADLSAMNADMTDEEHADAMAALLLLRDEAR